MLSRRSEQIPAVAGDVEVRFVLLDDHGDELKMHELRLLRRPQP
jgi:hypothetical protein